AYAPDCDDDRVVDDVDPTDSFWCSAMECSYRAPGRSAVAGFVDRTRIGGAKLAFAHIAGPPAACVDEADCAKVGVALEKLPFKRVATVVRAEYLAVTVYDPAGVRAHKGSVVVSTGERRFREVFPDGLGVYGNGEQQKAEEYESGHEKRIGWRITSTRAVPIENHPGEE